MDKNNLPGGGVLAVDLDGTILKWHKDGWQGLDVFGEPMEGVIEALTKLQKAGFVIAIHTCRTNVAFHGKYAEHILKKKVENELIRLGIPFDFIAGSGKPVAHHYIDDMAIKFESWKQVLNDLNIVDIEETGNGKA